MCYHLSFKYVSKVIKYCGRTLGLFFKSEAIKICTFLEQNLKQCLQSMTKLHFWVVQIARSLFGIHISRNYDVRGLKISILFAKNRPTQTKGLKALQGKLFHLDTQKMNEQI